MSNLFKVGTKVRRRPGTTTFPELYEPFVVEMIQENPKSQSGYMVSEDGFNWVCESYLEPVGEHCEDDGGRSR